MGDFEIRKIRSPRGRKTLTRERECGCRILDNALMESQIGLYKTELIKPRRPWRGLADVELATAEWVDWFNHQRIHTAIGDIPPAKHETNYYAHHQPQPTAGTNP
jgi:putative transposase